MRKTVTRNSTDLKIEPALEAIKSENDRILGTLYDLGLKWFLPIFFR